MNTTKIGDYIRDKRELNGWTQEVLAEKVGVSSRTIHNWEAGKVSKITLIHLEKIAEVLGVSLIEVYNGKDMPELDASVKEGLSQTIIPALETIEERGLLALDIGSFAAGLSIIAWAVAMGAALPQDTLSSLFLSFMVVFGLCFIVVSNRIIKKKDKLVNKLKRSEKQDK